MSWIKTCPLCGGECEVIERQTKRESSFVWCTECGCTGPIKPTEDLAVQAWNDRYQSAFERKAVREVQNYLRDLQYLEVAETPGEALIKAMFWELMKLHLGETDPETDR